MPPIKDTAAKLLKYIHLLFVIHGRGKALHEIKSGEEIAIAVFKNDENYLIAVPFRERDSTFEQARSYLENNPNFDT